MRLAKKERCSHLSTTLVQAAITIDYDETLEPMSIWFACYQCDLCGGITRKEVSADHVDAASLAPWLDEDFYMASVRIEMEGETEWKALQFMAKAVRR